MSKAFAITLAIVLSMMLPTAASPQGQIVVRGAASGSHLRVTVGGEGIVIDGYLAAGGQRGCRFTRGRNGAVCPLAGVASMVIVMGPSGDMVEILEKLPCR